MKTKLFSSAILMVMLHQFVAAQEIAKPEMGTASFGIYGGVNFQNINGKDATGDKLENKMVTRFHVGINEEIPVAPEFFFQVGLQFISKGTKGTISYNDKPVTRTLSFNYLEIPLNFVYKPLVGTGNFILGFGPYVGYAIGGKAKFEGESLNGEQDIKFQKSAPDSDPNNAIYFKNLDVGANFFFGYQFVSGINMTFNSQLGLININSEVSNDLAEKNTGFGLSLGYRF